jgi:hypothetical protein
MVFSAMYKKTTTSQNPNRKSFTTQTQPGDKKRLNYGATLRFFFLTGFNKYLLCKYFLNNKKLPKTTFNSFVIPGIPGYLQG